MKEPVRLDNGIRVHLIPFAGTEAVTVLVLNKVGSRHEDEKVFGAAHFIEHLMFKGTERRPSTLEISRELDSVGAEFNAYTGKDLTGYYVKADSAKTALAVDLLHDMLFHSKYDSQEIDRERGVIIEEINMYEDNPLIHIEELLEDQMFAGNNLGRPIAGTRASISQMKRADIVAFRDRYYIPSRMVIAVAGKVGENILELLNRTFGQVPAAGQQPTEFEAFQSPAALAAKVQFKETEQIQVALGFQSLKKSDEDLPVLRLMSIILGGTMSSRLFISVRERKGLAYLIRCGNTSYEDTGCFMIQSGLDQRRLPEAMATILEEIEKMKTEGVSDQELADAKNNLRGRSLLKLEDSSDRAEWYANQEVFLAEAETPEEWLKKHEAVTREQVQAMARRILLTETMSLAAIGPYGSGEEFIEAAGLKK
ncbi:insulinase family protein [Patescibacteria group bacterium]|nr:insulinase family protein [Patescibacteria group bacterium]